jgi:hypothetical protein
MLSFFKIPIDLNALRTDERSACDRKSYKLRSGYIDSSVNKYTLKGYMRQKIAYKLVKGNKDKICRMWNKLIIGKVMSFCKVGSALRCD